MDTPQAQPEEPQDQQPPQDDSRALGVSIRGWIALILVGTVCLMSGMGREVGEPLYSLSIAAVAFYFGHQIGQHKMQ